MNKSSLLFPLKSIANKNRNILLLEPNYKNKYPPIGLMKIATYHRLLGDNVTFYKGDLDLFVFEQVFQKCLSKLKDIEGNVCWDLKHPIIKEFLKKKDLSIFDDVDFQNSKNKPLIHHALGYYRAYFLKKTYFEKDIFNQESQWDRIYITTLFTFYWKATIETIEFAKKMVDNIQEIKVGGVMASLMPAEIEQATGIKPMQGLLDKPYMLDDDIDLIVDNLPLDYSILHEIDYEYPTRSAYITFMSKGCTRSCKFCAVPKIEPKYNGFVPTIDKFNHITRLYGEQQDLLLMDNNVLASENLKEIIEEIKQMGFVNGAMYADPNQLRIAIRNLRLGFNDKAYIRHAYKLIHKLYKRTRGKTQERYYQALKEHDLLHLETTTKANLIAVYPKIAKTYEKIRYKKPKQRFVDFNQGIDCRYITEEKMQLLSEIPIRPLRIAFDYITIKEQYVASVKLATKYGIKELSNYILFNFVDTPNDLYHRLEINDNLSKELGIHIYSFPMKYIPLFEEEAKNRDYIGKHWNKKFIRAIQCILNVTKGIVAPSRCNEKGDFFKKAFGNNLQEFHELLYMPETYIIYRYLFEEFGYAQKWRLLFRTLTNEELETIRPIIENNKFQDYDKQALSPLAQELMSHYTISRDIVNKARKENASQEQLKKMIDDMIEKEKFLNLSITYDFE